MCERYAAAVSANDPEACGAPFATDAIRVPQGTEPEHWPEAIAASGQKDYDVAERTVTSRPLASLRIDDDGDFELAEASVTNMAHAGGASTAFKVAMSRLVHREGDQRMIKRQLWNKQ